MSLLQHHAGFLDEFRLRASATPEAAALLAPGREPLTFRELQTQLEALARTLRDAGLTRNDVVATVFPNGPELISVFLGIASVAVCAPLNPALREAELEFCLRDLGARALVIEAGLDSPAEAVARALGIAVWEAVPALDRAAGIVTLRGPGPRAPLPAGSEDGDETAVLLYTSATSGKPKLVPLTHSSLLAMATNLGRSLGLNEADRFLGMIPLFHLQGLLGVLTQLLVGGSAVCTPGFDADAFPGWLEQFHPSWYTGVPALHSAILPVARARPEVLRRSGLRLVRSIGAPVPQALLADVESTLNVPFVEAYGLTETGTVTSNLPPPHPRVPGSVGRSAGPEVAITDETGNLLPPESEGEIVVRGPTVIRGYRNNPEANRDAFKSGWFRTGDLGRLDREGFLFVTGRIKEIINRGGEKVLPREIDETLAGHPAVAEAAAFAVAHPTLGEDVAAAVVLRPGASVSESELRRFAAARLAGFKVPRRIFFLEAIPKGATGKPWRRELAEQIQTGAAEEPVLVAASTPVEKKLVAIWQRVLGIDRVGVRDDFFSLGADSFALTLMSAELDTEFGARRHLLGGSDFFTNATIENLARIVTNSGTAPGDRAEQPPIVALQPHGSRAPFFCFPDADENPYQFLHLARRLGPDQPFYVVRDPRPLSERGVYTVEEVAARFSESIRSIQREGPYILGGHCYGGIVAFELARQLVSQGEDIGLLVLYRAPAPGYPKVLRDWRGYSRQFALLLSALVRDRDRVAAGRVLASLRGVSDLWKRKAAAVCRRVLIRRGLKRLIEPIGQVNLANQRAARTYRPSPLHCKVVQFVAAGEPRSTLILEDPWLGWRDVAAGGFAVHEVPGAAGAIFEEPNVRELAAQLSALLGSASATQSRAAVAFR